MTVIEDLANYIFQLKEIEMDAELEDAARNCLLDAIACGLYGSTLDEGKKIVRALSELGGGQGLPIWGLSNRLGIDSAALACSSFCHLREMDDVHYVILHPGSVVVPVAYFVGLSKKANLKDLLISIIGGIEAMVRIAKGMDYLNHRERGWHGTASCGSFGAAAAAGLILGLNSEQLADAISLAGSRTGGTWAFKKDGAMSKRLHPGLASRDGVLSAYLANHGIDGPRYVLEASDGGFYKATSDSWNLEDVNSNQFKNYAVEELEYKYYASCKSVHSPIEAAIDIYNFNKDIKIDDISEIDVEVNKSAVSMASEMYRKDSIISAQLSIQYGVAIGLMGMTGGAGDYDLSILMRDDIFELASKVKIIESPRFNELRKTQHLSGSTVTIIKTDGKTVSSTILSPKGSLNNPLDKGDLIDKFDYLTSKALGKEKTKLLADLILNGSLDTSIKEISQLVSKL